jgi:3-hydroxyisobutyrate dehydrogenase-like beta-hydroxyacid dehydrogenase
VLRKNPLDFAESGTHIGHTPCTSRERTPAAAIVKLDFLKSMPSKVGFLGLGAMGLPMAQRVIAAGYPLFTTFHRNRAPAAALAAKGATVLGSAAEVARAADVVITILPADAELEQTARGLAEGFSPGKTLIEMTTCTATTMKKVAQSLGAKGVRVLDAPVSGGTIGAEQGKLTIMVGGDAALLDEHRPLLQTMGAKIVHVGAVGQGKVVKIVNQAMAATHLLAIGEAFALGVRCGADPKTLYEVVKDSSGYSRMMDLRLPGFLFEGKFQPGFKLDLMKKDVLLALASAKDLGVDVPLASVVARIFAAASAAGHGEEDFAAAAQHLAGTLGAKLNGSTKA